MKKLLLSLLLVMTMGCVSAFAETITITSKPEDRTNFVANPNSTYGTATYTVSNTSFTATYVTTGGQIKVNATGAGAFNLHNTTALSGIKRVTLEATLTNSSSTLGTWHMKTSADAAVTENATESDIAGVTSGSTVTFTVPDNTDASYFHINLTTKGGGTVKFTKIEIEYTNSGTVDPVDPDALANLVIQYGDVTVSENDEISVATGTEFNISADNAESITIMDENMDELSSATGNTCTWAPNEEMDGVNITVTATKGDQTIETTFTLTVEEPDTRAEANLSFAEATVNFDINDEFVQQELTNTNDLTVTWSSTNADVASIDAETGEITIIATGTTVIRATFEGDDTTKPGYAEYTLVVANRNEVTIEDVLTISCFPEVTNNQYTETEYTSDKTGIEYTAKIATSYSAIQTNATSGNGIVTTSNPNGYVLRSVSIELNPNTSNSSRTLYVYASDSNFLTISGVTDGDEIGSITKADDNLSCFIESNSPYKAVGFKATGGALYINQIKLVWAKPADETRIEAELSVDGVATEWFDLSGRRVAAPAKGVYLRKQGAKVTKIAY